MSLDQQTRTLGWLDTMPPGPALAAAVETIPAAGLVGEALASYAKARWRLHDWATAEPIGDRHVVLLRRPGRGRIRLRGPRRRARRGRAPSRGAHPIGPLRLHVGMRLLDGSTAGMDDRTIALMLAGDYHDRNTPPDDEPGDDQPGDGGPDDGQTTDQTTPVPVPTCPTGSGPPICSTPGTTYGGYRAVRATA